MWRIQGDEIIKSRVNSIEEETEGGRGVLFMGRFRYLPNDWGRDSFNIYHNDPVNHFLRVFWYSFKDL